MAAPSTIGSYRFIAELGHGGMADVYLAAVEGPSGLGFTKLAVVKMLRSAHAEDPEFVAMLMDEARVTARLAHPNVVQLFEVGHVDDHYFLAMEFLEGQPLHRVARRIERVNGAGQHVPRDVFYATVSDVLAGLHHAHELADYDGTPLNVVHRDVTPHNVFVTYDGVVKVVDFGIAQARGRITETQHGVVKGKIRYMSPEQAACRDIDRRTDVFAAGVMLFNLASGTKLWADRTDAEVAQALFKNDYPRSPRERCADVPEEIDAICRKALSFKREERYPTAAAMRADIDAYLGVRGAEVRKTLTTTMKDAFTRERAQLRSVLESSNLTSGPSLAAFAAADPARRRQSRSARGNRATSRASRSERTELMPSAPALPARRPPRGKEASIAPMSVGAARDPRSVPKRSDRGKRGRAPVAQASAATRKSSGNAWTYAFAAVAVATVVAGLVRVLGTSAADADRASSSAATVASDLTSFSQPTRSKADQEQQAPGVTVRRPQHVGGASVRAPSDAPVESSASPAPASSSPAGRRPRGSLDSADPWSPAKP